MRVEIPSVGIYSQLMSLGIASDGTLEVPPGPFPAGWYTGAPTPGERGPAVIAGHVSWNGVAGVFADLGQARVDDTVMVDRADGTTAVFRVTHVAQFVKTAFPSDLVYGNIGHAALRLITCGGYNSDTGTFDDNVVVFARLVGARTA